ncbi:histidinol-phosphate transaminase [Phyllobacterium endophyticum]|uniref:Histidinol-phosphate aminotransferase n=1 Tax=Phyllobacterium endophyticum TaxID=1149773 RepID=A0A2P7AQN2_9HYPH|nr:histidinol-phosphate transaminase [Phyllobacterium endophyticum]MBB3236966.1 histidinol-phosphate aminotransferase [Phyllobacterium endophyticum]PSH56544.1 histidinol-phosphate transaminase [Phyllobacterium endophyticum]TYR44457.1 histidinol-phosphate transaminase [Phyllobacterium endophyticum]
MINASDLVRDEVHELAPYNSGLTVREVNERYGPAKIAKLASNENPLGPSPDLDSITMADSDLLRLYPDPAGVELREAIAVALDVASTQIILGNGSEELISIICRAVLRPRDRVVTLYPSFPLHEDYAALMGASVERVNVKGNMSVDVDTFEKKIATPARMVIFSNPMNPVGSWLAPAELSRVIAAADKNTLIVVDEAYAEYAAGEDYVSAIDLLKGSRRPWVVLRTMSKAYGLAGLRIGYGVVADPEFRSLLDRVRTPFNVNAIAQVSAVKALADRQHLQRVVTLAASERQRVQAFLLANDWPVAASKGNFLFFDCAGNAADFAEGLLRYGVIVKPWKQAGYETFVRVSVGSPDENNQFMSAVLSLTSQDVSHSSAIADG